MVRSVHDVKDNRKYFALTITFFAIGILLTVIGVLSGENSEILRKGVNICLECIGIG